MSNPLTACERCGSQWVHEGHVLCRQCEYKSSLRRVDINLTEQEAEKLRQLLAEPSKSTVTPMGLPTLDEQTDRVITDEHLRQVVNREIAKWPEWLKGLLQNASKPMRDTPREIVNTEAENDRLYAENARLRAYLHSAVRAMVRAFLELNTIRARDGVPWTHAGFKSSVTEEYFSSVVDELDAAVTEITGHSAHCHPELYKSE